MNDVHIELNPEVDQIASKMKRLAKRMNAQFVIDPEKAQDFAVAVMNRQKRKERESENHRIARAGASA